MPVVTEFPHGSFCWIELTTSDRQAAIDFYTKVFGWTTVEVPMGDDGPYILLQKNGTNVGALNQRREGHIPPKWESYVSVDNVDESAEKVKSLGGNIIAGPFDVMDFGRMAFATDPAGAAFALWHWVKPGTLIRDEANTLCWNELMTKDTAGSEKFYTSLFNWTAKGGADYTEWHLADGRGIGGMIDKMPPGVPPNWVPYILVDDTDATVDAVKAGGGSVHMGPMDFPNVGRFALLADPQGASFYVIRMNDDHH